MYVPVDCAASQRSRCAMWKITRHPGPSTEPWSRGGAGDGHDRGWHRHPSPLRPERAVGWPVVRIDVFTIFPGLVDAFCAESLLGKARTSGLLDLRLHDLREHTTDVHRTVDDAPFGGGAGMVMRPEPVFASVEAADPPRPLLLLGPGGRRFDQAMAGELAGARRVQPALRALRRGRPPRPRAPRRRRAERRRRRAQRRRGGRVPGDRGRRAAAARRDGQRGEPGDGELRRVAGCSRSRTSPARRSSAAGTCPTCCAAATTPGSPAGGGRRRCTARCATAPTWSSAAGGLSRS